MKLFIGELLVNFFIISFILFEINALYVGIFIYALKYMLEHSAAHTNPFITIVKFFQGNISDGHLIQYLTAQTIAAVAAYKFYKSRNKLKLYFK